MKNKKVKTPTTFWRQNIFTEFQWGKKKFMGREFMGIIRTTFLIDKKGKIVKIWDNVKVKDHAKEVLETVKNLS